VQAPAQVEQGLQARVAQGAVVQAPAQVEQGLQARVAQGAPAPVLRAVACPARAQPVRRPLWATCHSPTLDWPRAASRRA
jgi:hypothetical protein